MAFMARLRTAAGESPLALRITFMSWLRLVRRKWTRAAADSAVAAARRGRNGGLLTYRARALSLSAKSTARNKLRSFPRKRLGENWRRRRDARYCALSHPNSGLPEFGQFESWPKSDESDFGCGKGHARWPSWNQVRSPALSGRRREGRIR